MIIWYRLSVLCVVVLDCTSDCPSLPLQRLFAPEILQGKTYNKAVDWWAFGILAFEVSVDHDNQ